MTTLNLALKASEPVVRRYVVKLEKRNARLQEEIGDLEAQRTDQKNRIKALEKELSKSRPPVPITRIIRNIIYPSDAKL
jgi:predicted  nucleic acid-binding Zn-ribbon protein